MEQREKRFMHKGWITAGICVAAAAALIYTAFYGTFQKNAQNLRTSPLETENGITFLYQYSYVLFRDMYNKINNTDVSYSELYLRPTEGNEWIFEEGSSEYESMYSQHEEDMGMLTNYSRYLESHFGELENSFEQLNLYYDYLAEDLTTGDVLTNLSSPEIVADDQYFYLSFAFDENGNVSIGSTVKGNDPTRIRKYANEVMRNLRLENLLAANVGQWTSDFYKITMPNSFRITFCIALDDWQQMQDEGYYISIPGIHYEGVGSFAAYSYVGCSNLYVLILCILFGAALILPMPKGEKASGQKIYKIPAEAVLLLAITLISMAETLIVEFVWAVAEGNYAESLRQYLPGRMPELAVMGFNFVFFTFLFLSAWYLGTCTKALRELGIREYIKTCSLIYRIFPFLKSKLGEVYHAVSHFDVTKKAHRLILKIVVINAVILFIISSLWVSGLVVAAVYSLALYFLLKKYISDIQRKYSLLLGYINRIAEGNLNGNMIEDLGVFEPLKPQLIRIQRGFKKAVDEEVKSQKMKSELITNVSHDLKTPLTAIITYVNLLKDENLTTEQRKEYLDTLERKSLRLKVLIEDLFEVSKASTGNITLNLVNVDIMNLVKQVTFELSDKLTQAELDLRINLSEEKVILPLDSQKTYRIYENLIGNIAKYALPGTRVYIDGFRMDDTVVITLKNISAQEIHVDAQQLTERFMRGDASRNTEGSGLGLAIAKSFLKLQNGKLEVEVDGDLFKVTTTWKIDSANNMHGSSEQS